jgi:hypothetical protein
MSGFDWLTWWQNCQDPASMLSTLINTFSQRARDRKLRLFACAALRTISHMLTDRLRHTIAVVENYADGEVDDEARLFAWREVEDIGSDRGARLVRIAAANRAAEVAEAVCTGVIQIVDTEAKETGHGLPPWATRRGPVAKVCAELSEALRDIFNPWREVPLAPEWVTGRDATVSKLARAIYADRSFDSMPILADALEDAGCNNADMLNHCRGPGPHVRGCWVVDLILGKS